MVPYIFPAIYYICFSSLNIVFILFFAESNNLIHTSKGSIPTSVLQPSRHKLLTSSLSDGEDSVNSMSSVYSEESSDENCDENGYDIMWAHLFLVKCVY